MHISQKDIKEKKKCYLYIYIYVQNFTPQSSLEFTNFLKFFSIKNEIEKAGGEITRPLDE